MNLLIAIINFIDEGFGTLDLALCGLLWSAGMAYWAWWQFFSEIWPHQPLGWVLIVGWK